MSFLNRLVNRLTTPQKSFNKAAIVEAEASPDSTEELPQATMDAVLD
jgi:hypothetical protein